MAHRAAESGHGVLFVKGYQGCTNTIEVNRHLDRCQEEISIRGSLQVGNRILGLEPLGLLLQSSKFAQRNAACLFYNIRLNGGHTSPTPTTSARPTISAASERRHKKGTNL